MPLLRSYDCCLPNYLSRTCPATGPRRSRSWLGRALAGAPAGAAAGLSAYLGIRTRSPLGAETVAGRRWMPGVWAALAAVCGCGDPASTAMSPQGFD